MSDVAELEKLSSKELHDRAVKHAVRHGDVKFLWRLLEQIPAAEAATGNIGESEADIKYVLPMLDDYMHSGEGEIAEALRPMYIEYLSTRD
ncbi:hypothetical protein A5780_10225 [Nocardia sp. 852002-20019_SCH5090214]|jgi:hypothetical protein|uniref:Uncharacterized protein n=1 Tax=Nocardia nova TaxID=37330 RepID=A0A2S5ZW90_9NOCA|nr:MULTISPECIES: hypothetical protein [Nocardia]OBF72499.1 hypothetical protein A9X06_28570 [Mycobacterium sp. 852002-51759_SCH5129042]MBF6145407.1 hypothetical protein [Nocardia nova]MBF6277166.1 hypothetical protein [Nocardia nova]MBV7707958.1 hypothetical protein [Nocardia nova]MDN2499720.1 hypothetical protein [Nocardia nova]